MAERKPKIEAAPGEKAPEVDLGSEPQAEFGLDEQTRVKVYEPAERAEPEPVDEGMVKRAVETAKEAADKAAGKLSSGYRMRKGGRIFGVQSEGLTMDYEGGKKLDLRELVEGGTKVKIQEADEFGYDPVGKFIRVPKEMRDDPSVAVRVLRELARATAKPDSKNGKAIVNSNKARYAQTAARALHEERYLWWRGHEHQPQYEEIEREASRLRMAAEDALDLEAERIVADLKEDRGIDLEALEDLDKIKQKVRDELKAEQDKLVHPFDEEGNGYFTGEPAGRFEKWKANNEVLQDARFRRKIGKVPLNYKWVGRVFDGGFVVLGGAVQVVKPVRNFVRNRLWKTEKWLWRQAKAGFWGVPATGFDLMKDLMDVFGDWSTGSRKSNLFDIFGIRQGTEKAGKWLGKKTEDAKKEKTPKSPWEVEAEELAKYAKKKSKPKKEKKDKGGGGSARKEEDEGGSADESAEEKAA
ncbi:MAG: hypothetical protein ABIG32_04095 [Candidatus Uhrbacteria bacterium]